MIFLSYSFIPCGIFFCLGTENLLFVKPKMIIYIKSMFK